MSDLTQLDERALREFANALENFKDRITRRCDYMEEGINSCRTYMQDESSKQLMAKTQQAILDIKSCINPTVVLYEKILELCDEMSSCPEV